MRGATAAIVGIGATEFSKNSGRSELRLAVEAITSGLADAGLAPADVDGLVTFTMDGNAETAVARELGVGELRQFGVVDPHLGVDDLSQHQHFAGPLLESAH